MPRTTVVETYAERAVSHALRSLTLTAYERSILQGIRDLMDVTQLREKKTLDEIAKEIGINRNTLGDYRYMKSLPSVQNLMKLCTYFKTSPNDLLLWDQPILRRTDGVRPFRRIR